MRSLAVKQEHENLKLEYNKLGEQLQQMTVRAIAHKFEVTHAAITAIRLLDDDDIRLIRALIQEKKEMRERRKHLRRVLS